MSVMEATVDYEALTAEELVAQVSQAAAKGSVCLTSSFQTEDMVALHMVRQHLPEVPVIFLETGYHFAELIEYRDRMAKEWGLNLVNALPSTTVKEFEGQFGKLHIVQPTACCQARKVEPVYSCYANPPESPSHPPDRCHPHLLCGKNRTPGRTCR